MSLVNCGKIYATEPTWESLRLDGLKQYRIGNNADALSYLKKSLVEAKKSAKLHPSWQVLSLCDLATFFELTRDGNQALNYYKQATNLNRSLKQRDSEITNYLVLNYAQLLQQMGQSKEVTQLESQFGSAAIDTIGSATMDTDLTINLKLVVKQPGVFGKSHFSYKESDPRYDNTLLHVGLLKPNQVKTVTPWVSKSKT